jgi:hypothetical protein
LGGFFRGVRMAVIKNSVGSMVFFTGIENISKRVK